MFARETIEPRELQQESKLFSFAHFLKHVNKD
jgi:hypothetical protein